MSLSRFCTEQHEREQAGLQKLLLLGFLGSVGMHAIAFGLSSLGIWQRTAQAELSPIELLVIEPPPAAIAEQREVTLAEMSSATNNPAPAAIARANPETTAAPAPPPPTEFVEPEPEPEPIPETEFESELTELGEPVENADAFEEEPETTEEESAEELAAPPPLTESQLERLRNFYGGTAAEADPDAASAETTTTESTDGEASSTGEATETAANSGTDTRNGTNPSGDGTGRGAGSRTVACQNCAKPLYPESALESGVEGTPRVQVDINPDGTVRSVTLVQSSGNAAIDRAAIQAARSSSFQPVAGGASVLIEYDLTIEGSQRNREAQRRGDRRSVEVPTEETETTSQTARDTEAEDTTPNPPEAEDASNTAQESDVDNTPPASEPDGESPSSDETESTNGEAHSKLTPGL
ncbi:TonB family C-terminal domain protein [Rubidibacter lacunae KORDI 51-2]|uniref:TonB family C-terminal domain protein n=1 Tax=Rubidibacter lacunae KORDI 51-2 TaxID=582515 RepID=U5DMX7_9CHRO|nr:energy transducer TonB [Rubidibacter lacunae]ERN43021.1 TonB family C-terminal domain protein [Rubidibacter lacunae KORDI 51-2]